MEIFISRAGEEFGPYSRESALQYLTEGSLVPDDLSWHAGLSEWKRLGDLLAFAPPPAAEVAPESFPVEETPFLEGPDQEETAEPVGTPPEQTPVETTGPAEIAVPAESAAPARIAISKLAHIQEPSQVSSPKTAPLAPLKFSFKDDVPNPAPAAPLGKFGQPASPTPLLARQPLGEKKPWLDHLMNLIIVALVIGGGYYFFTRGMGKGLPQIWIAKAEAYLKPAAAKAAAPAPPSALAPAPAATPAPAAAVQSTPAPAVVPLAPAAPAAPAPIDWAALSLAPAQWPKAVLLKTTVNFPAMLDGKVIGSVTAPPGTAVKVTNIQADQITIQYGVSTQTVPAAATDIEARIRGAIPAAQ